MIGSFVDCFRNVVELNPLSSMDYSITGEDSLMKKKNLEGTVARGERSQGMAEYIIIVILVAIIVLVGVKLFGRSVINQFNNATGEIDELKK